MRPPSQVRGFNDRRCSKFMTSSCPLKIIHLDTVGSTSDYALKLLESSEPTSSIAVIADQQTRGRGRLNGRLWESPIGNFYCSYIVNLESFQVEQTKTNLLVSMAVNATYRYLKELTSSDRITLKIPNDILVGGKKLAGILVEVSYPYAVIGIGINLTNSPIDRATNLLAEFNLLVKPENLVDNLYKSLEDDLKASCLI